MKPFAYLRRHTEGDAVPFVLGGVVELLLAVIVGTFGLSALDHYLLSSTQLASVVSSVLVDLTNTDRSVNQLGGLTVSPVLTAAAQAKANDMAAKSYFAHIDPSDPTHNSWYWFRQSGYIFSYAGENLAVDFSDSPDVERAWMNSPTHRANLLNGHYTEIGIATAQGTYKGHPTTFVAQMFGTPAERRSRIITLSSPVVASEPALATVKGASSTSVPATSKPTAKPSAPTVAVAAPEASTTEVEARLVLGTDATGLTAPVQPAAAWWEFLIASPKTVMRNVYYVLGFVILGSLAYATELEFHKRHMKHLAAAGLLLVLMIVLFVLAHYAFFATPLVAAV